jgi:hypothetical protein
MHFAAGVADPQRALADETPKQIGQQTHGLSVALCDRAESEKCPATGRQSVTDVNQPLDLVGSITATMHTTSAGQGIIPIRLNVR